MYVKKKYIISIILFLFLLILVFLLFNQILLKSNLLRIDSPELTTHYSKHYTVIVQNPQEELWQSYMDSINKLANPQGIYVELAGKDLDVEYSPSQLLEMKTMQDLDGIIIEADDSILMRQRINKAVDKNIPIVTILKDAPKSNRPTALSLNPIDVAQAYARQIIKSAHGSNPSIGMFYDTTDMTAEKADQILDAIRKTLAFEGNHFDSVTIKPFNLTDEEKKLDLNPSKIFAANTDFDIVLCLNTKHTLIFSKWIKDNALPIQVIGYLDNSKILEHIKDGRVTSAIVINPEQMAVVSLDALNHPEQYTQTKVQAIIQVDTITQDNLDYYFNKKD